MKWTNFQDNVIAENTLLAEIRNETKVHEEKLRTETRIAKTERNDAFRRLELQRKDLNNVLADTKTSLVLLETVRDEILRERTLREIVPGRLNDDEKDTLRSITSLSRLLTRDKYRRFQRLAPVRFIQYNEGEPSMIDRVESSIWHSEKNMSMGNDYLRTT